MKIQFFLLLMVFSSFALRANADNGKFVNLGPQLRTTLIQGSAFLRDPSGRDMVYTVVRGEPAHLLGYEIDAGKLLLDTPLHTDGAWNATVSTDGWLYLPGGNGHLLRYKPGASAAEDLGTVLPGETVIWDVTAGADGEVFGATYPGCRVFRYHPKDGFSDLGHGPLVQDENYVRTVAYDASTRKVYAGVGSHAHLIELDAKTGEKTELLADEVKGQEAVYTLKVLPDAQSGDRLLIWVTNVNHTLVYNLKTRQIERTLGDMSVKSVIESSNSDRAFYCDGTQLRSIDLSKPDEAPKAITRCIGANASRWLDDGRLCVLTRYAQLLRVDPVTNKTESTQLTIPPQPIPIQSIEQGPDGKIWMGGFLSGGTASYDPETGKSEFFRGMSQIEHFGVLGDKMYLGIYPHGRLYEFDPAKAWSGSNPKMLAKVEGQSRPVAVLGVPEISKLFIGMVPEYGILGGHLLSWDPTASALADDGEVVEKQSVVSLVWANKTLIGGTSITGGLGIKPSEKEAELFGWDPVSAKKTFQITPVPDATAITSLIIGPDKNVWGVANGTLFIFDPETQKILSTHELLKLDYAARHYNVWRDAFLVVHPSGQVYCTLDDKFFVIDPATWKVTILRNKGAQLLAMDQSGRLYFRDSINLWQYTP